MNFTSMQEAENSAYFADQPVPATQQGVHAAQYAVVPSFATQPGANVAHFASQPPPGVTMQPVGVPPGLELLIGLDELRVHENNRCLQLIAGVRTYTIFNKNGHACYLVGPPGECTCKQCELRCCQSKRKECRCCVMLRDFNMYVLDQNRERAVINVYRDYPNCAPSCTVNTALKVMHVDAPAGVTIGSIKWSDPWFGPTKILVRDVIGQTQLVMMSPCCDFKCCSRSDTVLKLEILTADESAKVGSIKKKYPGCYKDTCFNSSEYIVTFPVDLDVKVKAVLMIAPFFIDLLLYRKWILENQK